MNHSVSAVSSTATYSNIQLPGAITGSTDPHLIYSNIGNHTNSELSNTYSNVGAFSAASNVCKFWNSDVFWVCMVLQMRFNRNFHGSDYQRSGMPSHPVTWIPLSHWMLDVFLVQCLCLLIKLIMHIRVWLELASFEYIPQWSEDMKITGRRILTVQSIFPGPSTVFHEWCTSAGGLQVNLSLW